jgi:hypothetical protein
LYKQVVFAPAAQRPNAQKTACHQHHLRCGLGNNVNGWCCVLTPCAEVVFRMASHDHWLTCNSTCTPQQHRQGSTGLKLQSGQIGHCAKKPPALAGDPPVWHRPSLAPMFFTAALKFFWSLRSQRLQTHTEQAWREFQCLRCFLCLIYRHT